MQRAAVARRQLINDMRHAWSGGELLLYFQPVVCMARGTVSGVEALLRWRHPQRGIIWPGEFAAVAEETGMMIDIGGWVFEEALRQVQNFRQMCGQDIRISINTSPVQYSERKHDVEHWRDYLRRCEIPEGAVSVEITEALLMSECSDVGAKLAVLRESGIQLALDEFGAGCSALASLKRLDIDYIKIDQSFIGNLSAPASAAPASDIVLCEAIIAMAHKLGIKVIAVGVETARQHQLLQDAGCDFAQGYWYAEPMSFDEFQFWYQSRSRPADDTSQRDALLQKR